MNMPCNIASRRAASAVSVFSFTGLVRYYAGLFCYYYFYCKTLYDRMNPLPTA